MATILIAGGSGLIGTALSHLLVEKGNEVIILSRRARSSSQPGISYATWDTEKQTIDPRALEQADAIINLSGANVGEKRWTSRRKQEIVDSRVKSAHTLIKCLKEHPNKVEVVINASAIGWYGPDPVLPNSRPFQEGAPAAPGFLGETCATWEESIMPVTTLGKRLVILRTGIVMSPLGGALVEFKKPVRFGIAGILGSGRQIISWIHIHDLCRIYLRILTDETMKGVYNAVAPEPVSNKVFTLALARAVKGSFFVPVYVPAFALKLLLGEMSIEVLKSATVSCEKLHMAGFRFTYPSVESALPALL